QERHPVNSDAADRKEFAKQWRIGAEQSGLSRRKLIGGALGGAIGIMAVPAIV
ncbi:MAG TPA: ubiquinol-cytochrome C reductase, partial [Cutibacterium acnes]|nr:ubiquinol-cytochrome C reductase [Cutibacterium acnes]